MIPTQRTQVPFSSKAASSTSSKMRAVPRGHCSPERTVLSPEHFTVDTTTNHAPTEGANPKYFLPDLTIAISLQEYSATQDARVKRGKNKFLWPKVWFRRPSTSELSGDSQPAHPWLFTGQRQYQTGVCPWKLDSYGLLCAWHRSFLIPVSPVPASAFTEIDRLLNMDLYHLQEHCWPICEIALCLLKACARDVLFPPSSSSIDGSGLSACQLSLGTV